MAGFTPREIAIAANIRTLRELRGWSQAELAERIPGWSATTVSKVESPDAPQNRHLSADELAEVAEVFGVSMEVLVKPTGYFRAAEGASVAAERAVEDARRELAALLDAIHAFQDAHVAFAQSGLMMPDDHSEDSEYGRRLNLLAPELVEMVSKMTDVLADAADATLARYAVGGEAEDGISWQADTRLAEWLWRFSDQDSVIEHWRLTGKVAIPDLSLAQK